MKKTKHFMMATTVLFLSIVVGDSIISSNYPIAASLAIAVGIWIYHASKED